MIIRGDGLEETLSEYLVDRIFALPQIEVLAHKEVTALEGDHVLEAITLTNNQTYERQRIETKWLFLCIGGVPQTEWAAELGIVRDEAGYLVTGPDLLADGPYPAKWPLDRQPYYLETSLPGLFAARLVQIRAAVVRGRRCSPQLGEALRLGRRRRRDGRRIRAPLSGKPLMEEGHEISRAS